MKETKIVAKCGDCNGEMFIDCVSLIYGEDRHVYLSISATCLPCQMEESQRMLMSIEEMVDVALGDGVQISTERPEAEA